MKKLLLLFLIGLATAACDDDSNNNSPSQDAKVEEVQNIAVDGQWRITYFEDSGDDETAHFTGFIFEFDSNDMLTASDGASNYAGTWLVNDNDGNDDDDDNNTDYDDIDFNIIFTSPDDFEELSQEWDIISIADNKIELRHVSGGNGGTDLLTFEKI